MKAASTILRMGICLVLGTAFQLLMPVVGVCAGAYGGAICGVELARAPSNFQCGNWILGPLGLGAVIGALLGFFGGIFCGMALTAVTFAVTCPEDEFEEDDF